MKIIFLILCSLFVFVEMKRICVPGVAKHNVTLSEGINAGTFLQIGSVASVQECVQKICEKGQGDAAFLLNGICYAIECVNTCETTPHFAQYVNSILVDIKWKSEKNLQVRLAEKNLQVRLANTDQKNYGIVEIKNNSTWKKICVYSYWDKENANVVCKMLGYKRAFQEFHFTIPKSAGHSGMVSRRYHCTGKEATLAQCSHDDDGYSCVPGSDYYVGAFCEENAKPPPVNYRLFYATAPNTGYLLVQVRGVWGTVCSYLVSTFAANIACQEMGFLGFHKWGYYYPEDDAPAQTVISWEINESCKNSTSGNCSQGDMWRIYSHGPCIYPSEISCKVAKIPDYSLVSGCPPTLNINRTVLTEKEKKLITFYQVQTSLFMYSSYLVWSVFYIPGNTTTLVLGDGKKYVKGINKPLEAGDTYYVYVRGVYADKNGTFGYGDEIGHPYVIPSVVNDCPASPGPSEQPTNVGALTGKKLSSGHIAGIVIGVLVVIAILGIVFVVYKKRKSPQQGVEHVKLDLPEDQNA